RSGAAILVSNNRYRLGRALSSGTRPRLDRAELGITVIGPRNAPVSSDGGQATRTGEATLSWGEWTSPAFEPDAAGPVPAGIDGEAMTLEAPLHFKTRPGALRVRIAPSHPGASPSAFEPDTMLEAVGVLMGFVFTGSMPGDDPPS